MPFSKVAPDTDFVDTVGRRSCFEVSGVKKKTKFVLQYRFCNAVCSVEVLINTDFEILSLEVVVNGVEVHSKLKTMAFPDYEATAQVKYTPQNLEK